MTRKAFIIPTVFALAVLIGTALVYGLNRNPDLGNDDSAGNAPSAGDSAQPDAGTEPHPYSIDALRKRPYDGGSLSLRDLGDRGEFKLYVASYVSDGLKLNALMSVPDSEKPAAGFPVIVLNHGFIEPTVYSTVDSYRSYFDQYARQGFIVLKPDYRGHDGSEGEPGSAHISPDYTVDVLNLVDAIKKYPDANPEAIGMWGHSMGGGITLRAMAVSQDIKAAALLAGVVASPQSFYEYWNVLKDDPRVPPWIKERAEQTLKTFGTPGENPELWRGISPYTYVGDMSMPVQIHHGTSDADVPIVFSDELNSALGSAGKSVEYFKYQGGDHNLAGAARGPVLSRTIEFFRSNLK